MRLRALLGLSALFNYFLDLEEIDARVGGRPPPPRPFGDYAPSPHEAELVEAAFRPRGTNPGTNLREPQRT